MTPDAKRAAQHLAWAIAGLLLLVGVVAWGVGRLLFRDPSNVPMPVDAPPGLEAAGERSCVLGYEAVDGETSHIVRVEPSDDGFAVVCAYGPFDLPRMRSELECIDGAWHGPLGFGPNGSHGSYEIAC